MFLYQKFFGRNPVEAELHPAVIENTTQNSTGFSYHLTQVIKGTMLLGVGVAGYFGISSLWKGKGNPKKNDASENKMDLGIEEALVPRSSKTITTPSIADSRNGLVLSMSDVNQFSTQVQKAPSPLLTTTASNPFYYSSFSSN